MDFATICTAAIESLTSIVTTIYKAYFKGKMLKRKDKRGQQLQVNSFIINAQTCDITELEDVLRKYIAVVQYTKDQLRTYIYTSHNMSADERLVALEKLREKLIASYSNHRSLFDRTPYGGYAHATKRKLLNIILKLESSQPINPENLLKAINLVSTSQKRLTQGIHHSVSQMQQRLQQTYF